jgi:hypothetical protein
MIQNIIVAIIILGAIAYTAWSVYRSVRPGVKEQNTCGGCTGCELKNIKSSCELPAKNSTLAKAKVPYSSIINRRIKDQK